MLAMLLALVAGPMCTRDGHMTKPLPICQIINNLKRSAPPESFNTQHGFPMPRVEQGTLVLAVILVPCRHGGGQGVVLSEPRYLAIFDPTTGERTDLRRATADEPRRPRRVRQGDRRDMYAPGQTKEAFLRDQEALYTAFDVLLPLFAEGRTDLSPEQKKAAATFKDAFPRVNETVLAPYYRHVGQAWFAWLDRVSR